MAGGHTVTWSIQTISLSSMVMASPPQTYLGLISVIAMFLLRVSEVLVIAGSLYALDDDVASTANNTETLALDDTSRALTNEGLVRGNGDTEGTGVVTGYC